MSYKAQNRRSQNDDSDGEQELHDKKHKSNSGGSNGYSKGKQHSNRKGSDDDSDSENGYQSKSKAGQKSDKKYDSRNRNDDSGSGEEEKSNGAKAGPHEVIIKGLPFASSDQDISDFFQDCGEVESINLLKGPDGRSKGIAFVKFFDEKSLKKAIELSGSDLGGRTVQVEKTVPKEQRNSGGDRGSQQRSERDPNSTTVFIGNLSYNTDQESIREIFEPCGKIKDVRIASDQDGKPRGFGYVEFSSADSIDKAIQKTGTKLDGRAIRVDFTSTRKNDNGGGGSRGFGGGRNGGSGGRNGYGGGGNRRGGSRY